MQGKNVSKICASVTRFFHTTVNEVNKNVKFVKRKSKLTARLFCEMLITSAFCDKQISLERMCVMLKEHKIKITKQGLHQRFTDQARLLMQNLFEKSLVEFKTEKSDVLALLKPFSSVKLTDSTGISLPANLKSVYKGHGGVSSEAGIKLQLMFDYLHGQVNKVTMTDGRKSDQGFSQYFEEIEKNALYVQDLGYFKLNSFANIHNNDAYFISRHLYSTLILNEDGQRIDLYECLTQSNSVFEKNVLLGEKQRIPVRLIAFPLPDDVVEKRLRKIRREFQRKGKTPSAEVLKFAKWSMFITNISGTILNVDQVYLIYKVRWQIELLFKLCKSEAGINSISGKNQNRVICEIYAKLINIVKFLFICFSLKLGEEHEISYQKAYKSLKMKGYAFFVALKSSYRFVKFIEEFIGDIMDCGLKDKRRKKRKSTCQVLMASKVMGIVA